MLKIWDSKRNCTWLVSNTIRRMGTEIYPSVQEAQTIAQEVGLRGIDYEEQEKMYSPGLFAIGDEYTYSEGVWFYMDEPMSPTACESFCNRNHLRPNLVKQEEAYSKKRLVLSLIDHIGGFQLSKREGEQTVYMYSLSDYDFSNNRSMDIWDRMISDPRTKVIV